MKSLVQSKKSFALKGFTLIEGIISISIIGIGFGGLLMAFPKLIHTSLLLDQTIIATNLAREAMEKVIAKKDCQASGCGYSNTLSAIDSNDFDENPVSGFSNYVLDTSYIEVDSDDDDNQDDFLDALASSGYARVSVSVSWNNGDKSIKLDTLIADY